MNDATVTLVIYIVSIAVITVVFVALETQHVHIQLSALLQAVPVIIAAVTAIQRAISSGQGGSTTSTTTVTTDHSAKNLHVEVAESDPVQIGKPPSPKAP